MDLTGLDQSPEVLFRDLVCKMDSRYSSPSPTPARRSPGPRLCGNSGITSRMSLDSAIPLQAKALRPAHNATVAELFPRGKLAKKDAALCFIRATILPTRDAADLIPATGSDSIFAAFSLCCPWAVIPTDFQFDALDDSSIITAHTHFTTQCLAEQEFNQVPDLIVPEPIFARRYISLRSLDPGRSWKMWRDSSACSVAASVTPSLPSAGVITHTLRTTCILTPAGPL
jgi:hypothetical protein